MSARTSEGPVPAYFLNLLDLNADHVPDLGLRLGSDGQSTDFYTLDSNGIFHPQGSLGIQTALWSIADLNDDGRPDPVTVGQNTHTVFVTLSRPPRKATPKCKRGQRSTRRHPCHR